jgi:hypothetical protein
LSVSSGFYVDCSQSLFVGGGGFLPRGAALIYDFFFFSAFLFSMQMYAFVFCFVTLVLGYT